MTDIDKSSIHINTSRGFDNGKFIEFRFLNSDLDAYFITANGIITSTEFYVYPEDYRWFRLFHALIIFSKPDRVYIQEEILDSVIYNVLIIYDEGICLKYTVNGLFIERENYLINPFSVIENIYYSLPLDANHPNVCDYQVNKNAIKYIAPWGGFKLYPVHK